MDASQNSFLNSTNYYLLKIIESVGRISGRKKLQKISYLMKAKGLPIEDDYFLHFYGPYSNELARRVDRLNENRFLSENYSDSGYGEYSYELTKEGKRYIHEFESVVPDYKACFDSFQEISALNEKSVQELELASTILYWLRWGTTLEEAIQKTELQKKVFSTEEVFIRAKVLAEGINNRVN